MYWDELVVKISCSSGSRNFWEFKEDLEKEIGAISGILGVKIEVPDYPDHVLERKSD